MYTLSLQKCLYLRTTNAYPDLFMILMYFITIIHQCLENFWVDKNIIL